MFDVKEIEVGRYKWGVNMCICAAPPPLPRAHTTNFLNGLDIFSAHIDKQLFSA